MGLKEFSNNVRRRSDMFCTVISACKSLLKHSDSAKNTRKYVSGRIDSEFWSTFHIGYFPDDKHLDEIIDLVGVDVLLELGLVYDDVYSPIPTRRSFFNDNPLIFPYEDEYGNIIALAGRALLSESEMKELGVTKYKNTHKFKKKMHLFGLYQAQNYIEESNTAILVEGQIDCISCHNRGYKNVVGLCGSDFSIYQLYLILKRANKLYLILDNDSAGKSSSEKIINKYSRYIDISNIELPSACGDVDKYLNSTDKPVILDAIC